MYWTSNKKQNIVYLEYSYNFKQQLYAIYQPDLIYQYLVLLVSLSEIRNTDIKHFDFLTFKSLSKPVQFIGICFRSKTHLHATRHYNISLDII